MNCLHQETDFATVLPRQRDVPRGCIPVNDTQDRIDTYIPQPSKDSICAFNERIAMKKLCNSYHLKGYCANRDSCTFDHSPITSDILIMLKAVARSVPCQGKGLCRTMDCYLGHICQRADCKHRGGKAFCKIGYSAHLVGQDLYATDYVEGHSARGTSTVETEAIPSVSSKDSTSSPGAGSDGRQSGRGSEEQGINGAWLGDVEEGAPID